MKLAYQVLFDKLDGLKIMVVTQQNIENYIKDNAYNSMHERI
jgi:hypothetical protein